MITVSATAVGVFIEFPMPALNDLYPNSVGWVLSALVVGALISVVAAFFILGGTYAALMLLRPGNLKHLFSTIGIFIAHLRA